uniref:Uncharacterized protein n=1 Tax=Strombidinopsis acuminata TaxID=141414 RepID=A0A7S3W893_9SPIT|mmetsp:Transcript_11984/g.36866  ORF Transcript_11984/g.36866 Transcript_11984/m.36866 type:complete len:148 (+) Transcript_11984:104-547(+)
MTVQLERGSHTLEEESAHGYAGILLLSLVFSFSGLQTYTGLETWQNVILFLGFWVPTLYFFVKWYFRETPEMIAEQEAERLEWLKNQAKGAQIYAEQMWKEGNKEAAQKAEAASKAALAELEEIATKMRATAEEEKAKQREEAKKAN